ncbi:MAG TPA: NADH-quinone oxidoreductase subunit J [Thermoanaerobaculia bacterium]|nr:NADH-quinone oxidoreductase subunit J [Thermoanaerobaculia bacterium]
MTLAVFVLFALLAVGFSLAVIAHPDPVKSTMSMVVVLFSLAVLFVLLGAPFIAALQVLLYTGAILVLFLFVIMLLNVRREIATPSGRALQRWTALITAAFFAGFLGMLLWQTYAPAEAPPLTPGYLSIRELARELFSVYLLPFEMVGLLLLVAVVAASLLARRPDPEERGTEGGG